MKSKKKIFNSQKISLIFEFLILINRRKIKTYALNLYIYISKHKYLYALV